MESLLDDLSYMKKVTAREFQHHFGKLTASLRPGQFIQVTKGGKVHGIYQRAPQPSIPQPNFLSLSQQHDYSERLGARLLKRLDEALS